MIVLKNGKKVFPEELEVLINRLEEVKRMYGIWNARQQRQKRCKTYS